MTAESGRVRTLTSDAKNVTPKSGREQSMKRRYSVAAHTRTDTDMKATTNSNSMGHPMIFTRAEKVDAPPKHQCTVGPAATHGPRWQHDVLSLGCLEITEWGCK